MHDCECKVLAKVSIPVTCITFLLAGVPKDIRAHEDEKHIWTHLNMSQKCEDVSIVSCYAGWSFCVYVIMQFITSLGKDIERKL